MANVAAMALFLSNNRNGGGGGFGPIREERKQANPDRYKDLSAERNERNASQIWDARQIGDNTVLSAYLIGECKITAWGTSNVENIFGTTPSSKNLNKIPEYIDFAEKKIDMITPPSFLEKMMVLRHTLAEKKIAKAASIASLGMTTVAAGMISLAARSYGKAKEFVVDRFLPEKGDVKQPTFSERLTELKMRNEFKSDIKKLDKLQKVRESVSEREGFAGKAWYKDNVTRQNKQTQNSLLSSYLFGSREIDENGKSKIRASNGFMRQDSVTLDEVKDATQKTQAQIDMFDPPTKMEDRLIKADLWLKKRYEDKPFDSRKTAIASFIIGKMADKYIKQQSEKDPNFKGKQDMFNRFSDIKLRRGYEADATKLHALQKKMTGRS